MGFDHFFSFGDCPKAKKSKTSQNNASYWAHLPSVLLHDIFNLLSETDRKNASMVCKNWRANFFHPKWWTTATFKIEHNKIDKAKFYIYTFGRIVSDAKINLSPLSTECMEEFINLLKLLSENNNLRSLIIEPTHCRFEIPSKSSIKTSSETGEDLRRLTDLLIVLLPNLQKFSIGCIEDLTFFIKEILNNLNPLKVTHLGLASVKDDPLFYRVLLFDPKLINPFTQLKVLTIDYDYLTDEFLYNLDGAEDLERLVVHLHCVKDNHPGTTEGAWMHFRKLHPSCTLRLTIIHAFKEIKVLHTTVMRKNMPLSHLKVFFCERGNWELAQDLSANYQTTLRSVMWVDSLPHTENSYLFAYPMELDPESRPDPFVLMAWLCKNLEELVLFGYLYWEENLVAIGRLRGNKLKKLEIADNDLLFHPTWDMETVVLDIQENLRMSWEPIQEMDMHPVLRSPLEGDSDEYMLPIVLADLH